MRYPTGRNGTRGCGWNGWSRRFRTFTLRRRLWNLACALGLLFGGAAGVHAQLTTATVTGSVHDASGATIPGATVTLTSVARRTSLDAVTNTDGTFVFPNVEADTYVARVALSGFKTLERSDIVVSPGDRVTLG